MTEIRTVLFLAIVLVPMVEILAGTHYRSRRSGDGFVLHKCVARAELMRRHRNGGPPRINLRSANAGLLHQKANVASSARREAADRKQPERTVIDEAGSAQARRQGVLSVAIGNGEIQRSAGRRLEDTPLRTVNIEATRKDGPLIFKKKDPLPELGHDVASGRKFDESANVVVIRASPVT